MAMDFLEICARMTSACPWPEGAEEQPALTESGSRIVSACASVAYSLLTEAERQRPTIDREALAKALISGGDAAFAEGWPNFDERARSRWLWIADTAIRLCAGADAGARIADLEARIATLTATANAAVERAEAAEASLAKQIEAHNIFRDAALAREEMARGWGQTLAANALRAVLDGKGFNLDGMDASLREQMRALKNHLLKQDVERHDAVAEAIARAEKAEAACRNIADPLARLQARAEEAEVRAAKAEKALRLSADAAEAATTDEEDTRQELYDARAENDRLRRAISVALIGAKHIATSAALLTGEADDA